jgi:hypothetical protein
MEVFIKRCLDMGSTPPRILVSHLVGFSMFPVSGIEVERNLRLAVSENRSFSLTKWAIEGLEENLRKGFRVGVRWNEVGTGSGSDWALTPATVGFGRAAARSLLLPVLTSFHHLRASFDQKARESLGKTLTRFVSIKLPPN